MKREIVTLQHQQDDQTILMTQQIEIQTEMQSDIQQLFPVMKVRRQVPNGRKQLNYFSRKARLIKNFSCFRSKLSYFECSVRPRSNNLLLS